ncbi:FtsX-like permease family protein [Candidatus Methylospira mobilis]|uniref:FtsX-like permease family protein n=1 Tax=Candidatus Methylospira mobilis TaxID=1808979 RepID=A0A5Q0BK64_9GAMM|nr:ABC transporter permease [Candidatus Methylospira mobilis]QFY44285.1 FtsX-like permease family protein [Candidatus Methylospira mobilis]WNV06291.1 ABC transporter permease [Candidatus Methylospira mobilis]
MKEIALKMLLGDRGKYIGIITGIALASLIMIQQPGIMISILSRTYSFITDVGLPDIWVMDPKVQHIDDSKPMRDTELYRVRSVPGVEWAVPLYKGNQKVRLSNGETVNSNLLGFDDATLIGGPAEMLEGKLEDLRLTDAVIVDQAGATGRLATPPVQKGAPATPLKVGDILEINDKRARVVGIALSTPSFQSMPIIYTTFSRAKHFSLNERKLLSFIVAKSKPGESPQHVAERIMGSTGLLAWTSDTFKEKSLDYFMKNTGILMDFGFMVVIGFIVGAAVTGQIFYNFTLDNLRYFAVFKAMGATDRMLLGMIMLQALLVGFIGYGIGAGISAVFAVAKKQNNSPGPGLDLSWQLLLGSGSAVLAICLLAAFISVRKVFKLEAAQVFKG